MFESAELGHKVDKKTYGKEEPQLRADLLNTQFDVLEAKRFPVLIIINGIEGAGKGETINLLNAWMDPRHVETHAMPPPSEEERERPRMWRFWRALPAKGKIGIFFGNWYTDPVVSRCNGTTKMADLDKSIEEINRFERMFADEGGLIIKFWLHLSKDGQKQRLKELSKDAKTRWRTSAVDWEEYQKGYDKYLQTFEHVMRQTSTGHAPWTVIDGSDERHRSLAVGRVVLAALQARLARADVTHRSHAAPLALAAIDQRNLLNTLDLTQKLAKKKYEAELEKWQGRLNQLSRHPKFAGRSVVAVFEGNDAAGKGGSIRRITSALDARQYQVVPIAAPTEEERAQPYMWRFWRHAPRRGHFTVFDRSWYGRVLVERVEGYCSDTDWMRAYAEINDFETQLTNNGAVIVKFWLTISADEQLRRFKEREETSFKRFKITEEDWRNRDKWGDYERAVCDMVDRTSTDIAPWTLVEAEDKYFARVKVLKTLCQRLEAVLEG